MMRNGLLSWTNFYRPNSIQNIPGQKVGFLTKIFGCEHKRLSRPISTGNTGHQTCLGCGAKRQFDPIALKSFGDFYFSTAVGAD